MIDLRTGKEMTRREIVKGGLGLAAILAAGKAPAMLLGARGMAMGGGGKNPYMTESLTHMWHAPWNVSYGVQDKSRKVLNDLVGNANFILTDTATVEDLAIYNSSLSYRGGTNVIQIQRDEVAYCEIVFKLTNVSSNTSFFSTGSYSSTYYDRCFGVTNAKSFFNFKNKGVGATNFVLCKFAYDFISDVFYKNGIKTQTIGSNYTLDVSNQRGYEFYLLGFLNSGTQGRVCSMRFHNSVPSESYRMKCLEMDSIFDGV